MKGQNEENLRKAQQWKPKENKEHLLKANHQESDFGNKEEGIKYEEKKLAARAFCERGPGINKLKEEVW